MLKISLIAAGHVTLKFTCCVGILFSFAELLSDELTISPKSITPRLSMTGSHAFGVILPVTVSGVASAAQAAEHAIAKAVRANIFETNFMVLS